MSKIDLSNWNHLCWPDTNITFNLEELKDLYFSSFSKYKKFSQEFKSESRYGGIGFQGLDDADYTTGPKQGIMFLDTTDNSVKPIGVENLGRHLEKLLPISVRHKELCTGELGRILDYLEDLGYHTYRGRIMECGPTHRGGWHIDSYPGRWGNNLRYHIPLVTNEECYIVWNEGPKKWYELSPKNDNDLYFHLPADGRGYWFNTDISHKNINDGDTWRYHIVIDLFKK